MSSLIHDVEDGRTCIGENFLSFRNEASYFYISIDILSLSLSLYLSLSLHLESMKLSFLNRLILTRQ